MFCSNAAKIVCGVSVGCTVVGFITFVVIPLMMFSSAASTVNDHVDGSSVEFNGGTMQVIVECVNPARNQPWGIFVASTEICLTEAAAITITSPVGTQVLSQAVITPQCDGELDPAVAGAVVDHLPALMKVASFMPVRDPGTMAPSTSTDFSDTMEALLNNFTSRVGTYTVNCASPCWVVDNAAVTAAGQDAAVDAATTAVGGLFVWLLGAFLLSIGSILCQVACCVALCSEEPDERQERRKGKLMDVESGEDE